MLWDLTERRAEALVHRYPDMSVDEIADHVGLELRDDNPQDESFQEEPSFDYGGESGA